MSGNATKLDSHGFSLFQKELHRRRADVDEDGKLHPSEHSNTIFQYNFKKISWYTPIKERLHSAVSGDEIIFTASNTYDRLMKTFLKQTLPALRIKSEAAENYRMAWTHNIGINITESAHLRADDVVINSFDRFGHDILSQYGYLVKAGFKEHHLISIGSVPTLEEWTTFLPTHQLDVLQPFFYARADHLAIPLLQSSLTQFRHAYRMKRNILSLLRMQKYNDKTGQWHNIKPNYRVVSGIKDKDAVLPMPELWGRYAKITDEERNWYKYCGAIHDFYYDDLVACDNLNKSTYDSVATIHLNSPTPVKAVFWVNENQAAAAYNNFSNYTTNPDNYKQGWNPNKKFALMYNTTPRVAEMDINHAEREETWEFPRAPWETGYNVITFCNNPFSTDGDASLSFKDNGVSLVVNIGNTDPNLVTPEDYDTDKSGVDEIEEEEESFTSQVDTRTSNHKQENAFIVRCRLLTYRKLSYSYDEKKAGYVFKANDLDQRQAYFDDTRA